MDANRIIVPEPVFDEVISGGHMDKAARAVSEAEWLEKRAPPAIPESVVAWDLGQGESSVIATALQTPGAYVIVDDLIGRKCGLALGIALSARWAKSSLLIAEDDFRIRERSCWNCERRVCGCLTPSSRGHCASLESSRSRRCSHQPGTRYPAGRGCPRMCHHPRAMLDELAILKLVTARLDAEAIPYMVTGSIALGYYAQPRMTRDVDLVVDLDIGDAPRVTTMFQPEFNTNEHAIRRAIERRSIHDVDALD